MPPVPLIHDSARVLEWDSLRALLRGYTASSLGEARIMALTPSVDRAWIENQHQLTAELREFRRVGGSFDFSSLSNISQPVEKSHIIGATLEISEIREVIQLVDRAAEWRQISLSPPGAM